MARAFRCKSCGTGYSTTGDDVPPSPNWADGHVCEMVEVKSKINKGNNPSPPPVGFDVKSLDANKDPDFTEEDKLELERNARLRIIGQNGNTGEHYDESES